MKGRTVSEICHKLCTVNKKAGRLDNLDQRCNYEKKCLVVWIHLQVVCLRIWS